MRLCAIIPTYRHTRALPSLTAALKPLCETVFIVDDGNEAPARDAIAALHAPGDGVVVLRRDANGGKGVAVVEGFRAAIAAGFTHALQIDADGQHDVTDAQHFVAAAQANPHALIIGTPIYDDDVPPARKIGRNITHFWVWVETFSFDVADSLCGFRIYPLAATAKVMHRVGARMDFDPEIAVRLHWRGVRVLNLPTRVTYPQGNVSNFNMLADNVRISLMHTRLALQAPFHWIAKPFIRREA